MTQSFNILRLSETSDGQSYFEAASVDLDLREFAPPAAPFFVSEERPASGYVFIHLPEGWTGKPHPAPRRQLLLCFSRMLRLTTSDGAVRLVRPGEACLQEDTNGVGHQSEAASDASVLAVIIFPAAAVTV
jgi:hypothetical protein